MTAARAVPDRPFSVGGAVGDVPSPGGVVRTPGTTGGGVSTNAEPRGVSSAPSTPRGVKRFSLCLADREYANNVTLLANTTDATRMTLLFFSVAHRSGNNGQIEVHVVRNGVKVRVNAGNPTVTGCMVGDHPIVLEPGDSLVADVSKAAGSATLWDAWVSWEMHDTVG